eukprot:PhF_6_TR35983/c0_g1_i2/m.52095/K11498/CENPE; centromeric protein E
MSEQRTIRVFVRLRPVMDDGTHRFLAAKNIIDVKNGPTPHVKWQWNRDTVSYYDIFGTTKVHNYSCARVFGPHEDTSAVYAECVRSLVDDLTSKGLDGCLCAYGQTNSGKTYTVFGLPGMPGILPRAVTQIFDYVRTMSKTAVAMLRLSMIEVYNESVRDLLVDGTPALQLQDHPTLPYCATNASEHAVASLDDVLKLIRVGEALRATNLNNVHEHASRSHCVVKLIFEYKDEGVARSASLHIVDLAGSETNYLVITEPSMVVAEQQAQETVAMRALSSGQNHKREVTARNVEGSNIRKSLLALVRCITLNARKNIVASGPTHIPYRDSKLTRILRHAVCGSCRTTIICTADPTEDKETLNTLRFASISQEVKLRMQDRGEGCAPILDCYEEQIRTLEEELVLRNVLHNEELNDAEQQVNEERSKSALAVSKLALEQKQLQDQYEGLRRCLLTANGVARINERGDSVSMPRAPKRRHSHPSCRFDADGDDRAKVIVPPPPPDFNPLHKDVIPKMLARKERDAIEREE